LTGRSKTIDPLAAMAAENPTSPAELQAELGSGGMDRAFARALALGQTGPESVAADLGAGGVARGRAKLALGLAVVLVALGAVLVGAGGLFGGSGGGQPQFAAAAIRVAEANPRLLVTEPGWRIVRADEFEPDSGELTFSDGSHEFEVHWYPAHLYEVYLRDRATVSHPEAGTLLGERATTVDYTREEYATMLSPQGSVFIEVRGQLGSKPAYDRVLHSLRPVGVETWLGAMPASTVRPEARAAAIDRMLRGISLPPGFDASALRSEGSIADEDTLAVKVGNAVACGWVQSWIAARASSEVAAAERAVEAIEGSESWPIVRETQVPWFSNYRVIAHQLRQGRLDLGPAGYEATTDGRTFALGPAWKLTLGCEGTYRREVGEVPEYP